MQDDPPAADELDDLRRRIAAIHESVDPASLPMWALFGPGTNDHPGRCVARLFLTLPDVRPTKALVRAGSLDELRSLLPAGLAVVPRSPGDDPDIVETWL